MNHYAYILIVIIVSLFFLLFCCIFILATYPEARARLNRATTHTDIESGKEDKASRAIRKRKLFEDVSDNSSDDTDEELENNSRKKSKKGGNSISNKNKLKIQPPQLPILNTLPGKSAKI